MSDNGKLRGSISAKGVIAAQIQERETLGGKMNVPKTFGTTDHRQLSGRDAPDQHPVEAIIGLRVELDEKISGFLTNMEIQKILDS